VGGKGRIPSGRSLLGMADMELLEGVGEGTGGSVGEREGGGVRERARGCPLECHSPARSPLPINLPHRRTCFSLEIQRPKQRKGCPRFRSQRKTHMTCGRAPHGKEHGGQGRYSDSSRMGREIETEREKEKEGEREREEEEEEERERGRVWRDGKT
jgi:hypothetical protein